MAKIIIQNVRCSYVFVTEPRKGENGEDGKSVALPEITVKTGSGVPLKATPVAPVKLRPLITTEVPANPPVGEKEKMTGFISPGLR